MKNSEILRAKRCKATCLFKSGSSHRCFPVDIGNFSEHFFCKIFANDGFYYFMCLIFVYCREAFLVLQMCVIWRIEVVSSAFYYTLLKKKNSKIWYLHFHKTYDHQFWTAGTSTQYVQFASCIYGVEKLTHLSS